jgi:hypothetical protein
MTRNQKYILYGLSAAVVWYMWKQYQQVQLARRLAVPVLSADQAAAVASSAPSSYNF